MAFLNLKLGYCISLPLLYEDGEWPEVILGSLWVKLMNMVHDETPPNIFTELEGSPVLINHSW